MLLQRIDYHTVARIFFCNVFTSEKSDNSAMQMWLISAFSVKAASNLSHAVRFVVKEGRTKKIWQFCG